MRKAIKQLENKNKTLGKLLDARGIKETKEAIEESYKLCQTKQ